MTNLFISDGYEITGGPKKYFNRRRIRRRLQKVPSSKKTITSSWYRDLIKEIITARRRLRLSQMQVASILGTNQAAISRLECGKANPTIELLDRVIKVLKIKIVIKVLT